MTASPTWHRPATASSFSATASRRARRVGEFSRSGPTARGGRSGSGSSRDRTRLPRSISRRRRGRLHRRRRNWPRRGQRPPGAEARRRGSRALAANDRHADGGRCQSWPGFAAERQHRPGRLQPQLGRAGERHSRGHSLADRRGVAPGDARRRRRRPADPRQGGRAGPGLDRRLDAQRRRRRIGPDRGAARCARARSRRA